MTREVCMPARTQPGSSRAISSASRSRPAPLPEPRGRAGRVDQCVRRVIARIGAVAHGRRYQRDKLGPKPRQLGCEFVNLGQENFSLATHWLL